MRAERTESVAIVTCEYPPFPGGIGTYAAGLVGALRGVGIPTAVFAPSYPDLPRPGPESDTARFLGHHAIGPGSMWRIASLLGRMPRNRLVLAADIRSMIALYVLQPIVRRPYRVMIHGSEVSKLQSRSPIAALARRSTSKSS